MVGRQSSTGSNHKFNNKNKKRFIDRKEAKTLDIQRALTHRARLRKNYFKLLKKEGIDEQPKNEIDDAEEQQESNDVDDSQSDSEDNEQEEEQLKPKKSKPSSSNKINPKELTYAEKAAIAKERRSKIRHDKLQKIQDKIENIARQQKIRELKKEQLKRKTKTGQPSMGPRINNLLDKIRKDRGN
ncbi:FYV7 [Candida pseudojiufengensis]|uniref:FYV7 n=1 Tax=Candida pseudojiufengensis TaxID=497109 RepID=UPI0022256296|nr:FYV7 [Candida pseudojiufengensis]KAI5964305.1 FYV7 [Candida pseudojiufengensis]